MKRFFTMILSLTMVFALATPAFAGDTESTSVIGTGVEQNTTLPETRAVEVPTSYAPSSWYGVDHKWTARYYTWSSYIFESGWFGGSFECWAQAPFTVERYAPNGTVLETEPAAWNSSSGRYEVNFIFDGAENYYVKIINNGSASILDNAYYRVYN